MGMHAGDGCLHLIGAGAVVAQRLVDQGKALGDGIAIPFAAVLIVQQHDGALAVQPGRCTGMLQQHQRRQRHDLRLGGKQLQQQARKADRFLAQSSSDMRFAPAGGVAFVEQQIEHGGDRGQALGPLDCAGCLIGHIRRFDAPLGPA